MEGEDDSKGLYKVGDSPQKGDRKGGREKNNTAI